MVVTRSAAKRPRGEGASVEGAGLVEHLSEVEDELGGYPLLQRVAKHLDAAAVLSISATCKVAWKARLDIDLSDGSVGCLKLEQLLHIGGSGGRLRIWGAQVRLHNVAFVSLTGTDVCLQVRNRWVTDLHKGGLHSLRKLQFQGATDKPNVTTIKRLAQCFTLHTVDMSGCPGVRDTIIAQLARFPALDTLILRGCALVRDVSALGACPLLRTLNLTGCIAVSDVTALAACPSLHTLDLTWCRGVSDVSALGACPSLHTLNLSDCRGVSDVSALAACPSLHTLNLTSCSGVSDVSGLGACPSLHTLNLRWCNGLRDVSGLGACPSLHTLHLRWCDGVSDASAVAHIPNLQT